MKIEKRVKNADVRHYVDNRLLFETFKIAIYSSFVGWTDEKANMFVVYSYGPHFPMYVNDAEAGWFGTTDKYSRTTSKHQTISRPTAPIQDIPLDEMKKLIFEGSYAKYCAKRLR